MVKRLGTFRSNSRNKLQKRLRDRGKLSLTKYFQKFDVGDSVALGAEPSVQTGMYYPRFLGKMGKVTGMQGGCYTVLIKDGGKQKSLIVHPVHLIRVNTR